MESAAWVLRIQRREPIIRDSHLDALTHWFRLVGLDFDNSLGAIAWTRPLDDHGAPAEKLLEDSRAVADAWLLRL